jgi:hypothetical protein
MKKGSRVSCFKRDVTKLEKVRYPASEKCKHWNPV